ncbi:protein tyrosine phosphatase [Hahella sp. CCB-MM4]|uniref:phosphatase domain-containing putative toxin n=1 Tax=Hahella sp. (strain CCB-MM4) TaxID=1926491 RepID=UPI000B9A8577|nr:tyrosine-protein phosphatase [Hahella sp. CCB-MM4]OZG75030.1 protein tyrosine phosphatase [Hahella sp. CCB-MM4]
MARAGLLLIWLMICSGVSAEPRLRPSDWAAPIIGSQLQNLYKVSDKLYRSEQPDEDEFKDISTLGIGEVLNLREYHSDDDEAEGVDLKLHQIKINAGDISEDQVIASLQIIQNSQSPILVHCWHGSDRTGAIVASYRVVFEGWPKDKAIDELVNGGYGYHESIYPNVVDLIKQLNVEKIRKDLGLH